MIDKAKQSKNSSQNSGYKPNSKPDLDVARQEAEAEIEKEMGSTEQLEISLDEISDLESTLGMEEVDLDPAVLDTIPADDTSEYDTDDDMVDEDLEEEIIDDRPQELTQSYSTGLQGRPSDRAGRYSRRDNNRLDDGSDARLAGGDVDANLEDANVVGEEGVGGTVATPDQDVVDELGAALGIEMDDRSFLRVGDMLEQRDNQRWELEPKSSEDYEERRE